MRTASSRSITSRPFDLRRNVSKFHRLSIARVDRETRDAVALTLAVPEDLRDQFRFTQGQHLTLRADIEGQDVRRSYSICSAVHDDLLRIAVKRSPGGAFSTWANEALKVGATIDIFRWRWIRLRSVIILALPRGAASRRFCRSSRRRSPWSHNHDSRSSMATARRAPSCSAKSWPPSRTRI